MTQSIERAYSKAVYEVCSYICEARNNWLHQRLNDDQTDDLYNAMSAIAQFANHRVSQQIITIGWDWRKADRDQSSTTHTRMSFQCVPAYADPNKRIPSRESLSFDIEALNWALNVIGDVAPSEDYTDASFRRIIGDYVAEVRRLAHKMELKP